MPPHDGRQRELTHFECDKCPLGFGGLKGLAVWGEGPVPADIMIVGQNPGLNEQREGRPFIGRAGQVLNQALKLAGLNRDELYLTNWVKHVTPTRREPIPAETEACRGYFEEELARVQPKVVVLMGAYAFREIFPNLPVGKANGLWRFKDGRSWVATYHPSALARGRMDLLPTMVDVFRSVEKYIS